MRSWSSPISSARVGWQPTADGMRPSSVETSEPACTKRKMLSMNNSTSWFISSRKYSAMVRADRTTRSRTPGGVLPRRDEPGRAVVHRQHLPLRAGGLRGLQQVDDLDAGDEHLGPGLEL